MRIHDTFCNKNFRGREIERIYKMSPWTIVLSIITKSQLVILKIN